MDELGVKSPRRLRPDDREAAEISRHLIPVIERLDGEADDGELVQVVKFFEKAIGIASQRCISPKIFQRIILVLPLLAQKSPPWIPRSFLSPGLWIDTKTISFHEPVPT